MVTRSLSCTKYKEAAKNRKQTRVSPDPTVNPLYNLTEMQVFAERLSKVFSQTWQFLKLFPNATWVSGKFSVFRGSSSKHVG